LFEFVQKLIDSWPTLLFWAMGGATVVCSIGVVVTQNVVRSAVWLLFALVGTAGLFFLLGADFVGATQLLIYAGGTLILVIFGVMLTAQGPFVRMKTSSAEWTIAAVVGTVLLTVLAGATLSTGWPKSSRGGTVGLTAANAPSTSQLGLEFLGIPPQGPAASAGKIGRDPANIGYLLPFEIVSVHLLVVLIGAAYLARAKRRKVTAS
jgi:NADH:ubiquinone oxidoreductase subunit 6 (subunit J)